MVTYSKIETRKDNILYAYYVEGNENDRGIVSLDLHTKEATVDKFAPSDDLKRYGFHLMTALEDMATRECLKDSGTIMWY